jgi:hypothetical protein
MAIKPTPPSRFIDMTGQTFTRLTAVQYLGECKYLCRCSCGTERTVHVGMLRTGNTRSCGCLRRELQIERNLSHGKAKTREYAAWSGMITRCTNEKRPEFTNYGGRGITVAQEWRGPEGFERFLAHIGPRPSKDHSVERIENDGNYEPGNVKWATRAEQSINKRRNRFLMVDGVMQLASKVAASRGISRSNFENRVRKLGWSIERAASQPVGIETGRFKLKRPLHAS